MSITDRIVVMEAGRVHQIGKPQDVYDDPVDLFVAKFLGTPPINVFDGRVQSGRLYIGEEAVLDASGVADQEVTVGIRPEGFVLDPNGAFTCQLSRVEVMGRDVSVVSTHEKCQGKTIRSIVQAESAIGLSAERIRFTLKKAKVLLFQKDTGDRIRY